MTDNIAVVIGTDTNVLDNSNNNNNKVQTHHNQNVYHNNIDQIKNLNDKEVHVIINDALPKITKTKIRLGSNRRALKLKRFEAKRASLGTTKLIASTTASEESHSSTNKDMNVLNMPTTISDSSSSSSSSGSFSFGSGQTKHSPWLDRSRTPSATTSQRLVNSIVLTSDTFSILCDINAHRWIVEFLNMTSLAAPAFYVPSTHHYTFGSVHDLSHRLRKHSNKSDGPAFVLLKAFYLELKTRANGLFANAGDTSTMATVFDPQKNRKLSTALGDLSMINNISRAPTLIIAPKASTTTSTEMATNKPTIESDQVNQVAEDFVIALDKAVPAAEEVIDEQYENHVTRTLNEPSCVTCHSILVSLFLILLVVRYFVHFGKLC